MIFFALIFSSNSKDLLKPDNQNATLMLPVYGSVATASSTNLLYGKLSSISISCDNYNDTVKDFINFKITYTSPLPPTPVTELQASTCTIPLGKSTCISTVSMTPVPEKFYNLENATR
mgnify:CR=1 FL=1